MAMIKRQRMSQYLQYEAIKAHLPMISRLNRTMVYNPLAPIGVLLAGTINMFRIPPTGGEGRGRCGYSPPNSSKNCIIPDCRFNITKPDLY
jgi:hypothetical protein